MIVCGHSKVEAVDEGLKIGIDSKVSGAIALYPGQTLFGAREEGSSRFFLSPLMLTPSVSYFRMFLGDERGSLASVTKLFTDRSINILSGGAFGFGHLWVSEFLADFKDVDETPDGITSEIMNMGGFITSREITELFPRSFQLKEPYTIQGEEDSLSFILPYDPEDAAIRPDNYCVLKAWPILRALFIDFFSPGDRLVRISVRLRDIPGTLNKFSELVGTQVNLHALDETHHDETSGVWNAYGVLEMGSLQEFKEKADKEESILGIDVEPLGWG
jgi:hypothetical protein